MLEDELFSLTRTYARLAKLLTQDISVFLDDGVHDGLCEHRLVDLVMAVLPASQIK